ncbi:peptide MFS transporter [Zunongwangia sp. F260]|uniref:Peptide MFS transporter n=1 Tax=Autumnicola lenta TaxID=3075593 RepID=A0ABU3CHJ1_9FLAO|nr:peptide MFS transporter [Zunongwangia sp. F260]MDT0645766.1 peptide MFS transporter [Zunongwangia sp. F260]
MEFKFGGSEHNQRTVLGHPAGLFVLFFTEMWERFSYYGMRALLVLFLTASLMEEGWGWERQDALILYGWYIGLVYVTPIFGGLIADKLLGYRNAVVWGALVMTLGHASMALEGFTDNFFYLGLILLILGNGLFKPNISSIVGQLYKTDDKEKDAGYTIFYMGINAGAFLGILLCGYIGENIGWHWGFGLAGVFMFFGMLQFYFGQKIFGEIGLKTTKEIDYVDQKTIKGEVKSEGGGKFKSEEPEKKTEVSAGVKGDRILVISVFALFTIFFWWAFEQAGGSMTIFAADYTDRVLVGSGAYTFKIINAIITIVPLLVITYVLGLLFKQTFGSFAKSNTFLGISFFIIWGIVIYILYREFIADASEVPASWFSVLNSLFIILFAPLFSKIWESRFNPTGPVKFGIGLILLGVGFGALAYGASGIPQGAQVASVSMIWLILAYFFHTIGELCVSPVGLSYVSKLSPPKLVGLMFGIWFMANSLAGILGGYTGGYIDAISEEYSLSVFFLIFTSIPILMGLIMIAINKFLVKKMHGIR